VTPTVVMLLGIAVRVWAIVRMQPWLRAGVGVYTEVLALGLGVTLAGLTISPTEVFAVAAAAIDPHDACAGAPTGSSPCAIDRLSSAQVRAWLVGEAVLGTLVGAAAGLVASAWLAVAGSPLFTSDLFAGRTSHAFVALAAALGGLLVFEAGAHHPAMGALAELARAPSPLVQGVVQGVTGEWADVWTSTPPGASGGARAHAAEAAWRALRGEGTAAPARSPLTPSLAPLLAPLLALLTLSLAATLAFVVSAGSPLVAIDMSARVVGVSATSHASAANTLAAVLRPALLLLWLATALTAMPAAWLDAFLAAIGGE
jgi:hypothetical protein